MATVEVVVDPGHDPEGHVEGFENPEYWAELGSADPTTIEGYDLVSVGYRYDVQRIRITLVDPAEGQIPQSFIQTLTVTPTVGDAFTLDGADAMFEVHEVLGSVWEWSHSGSPFVDYTNATFTFVTPDSNEVSYNCECADEHTGATLGELRARLMRRLGFAAQVANPPPGMADLLDDFLRDAQSQLYRRFSSLRTERFFRWTMQPGVRFYGVRANDDGDECNLRLDPYRITWAGIEDERGSWIPLIKGIPPTYYTAPLLHDGIPARYEIRQCIEVFPPPDREYVLRVKGHFGLQPFAADDDQSTIDSDAIFLYALGMAKRHYGQPDGGDYVSQAFSYVGALVAGSHQTARYVPRAGELPPLPRPRMNRWDYEG
jgi:hypothetical protein